MNTITTVAFDADDTLWRNEEIFTHAQQRFFDLLTPYHDEDYIKSHLEKVQIDNISHFGYGIKGFTLSMIETAIGLTEGRINGYEIHQIIQLAKEMLKAPVEILDGVHDALASLKGKVQLMIITKGDLLDQEGKVARSKLAKYFDFIEVVSDKNPKTYSDLLDRYQIQKTEFLMIGNSLKSDILPVLDIGSNAIHVPYHSTWVHEQVDSKTLQNYDILEAKGMSRAMDLLLETYKFKGN
ncbi:HAD family hydrolase [Marinomonas balearica]|uniref:Putative hydrolase of the HAD superfamily n=1 Tax=Marinomonas balearica TaxID=491947 RepID=A0A4R6M677_9GAMM|nr:HAD family hydrolase [Marinomonas balearica]TDO96774.1 putative hydrolase of the HAD superfamily [Marinomonas balearica]